MSNFAILIAVENYVDKTIPSRQYAAADLLSFSQALEPLDFPSGNQTLRLNGQATKAGIESVLINVLRSLTSDDTLFIYCASHGFAINGVNYMTCHDTHRRDLVNTSISHQRLYDEMKSSRCQRIAFFLDSCHKGIPADASTREIHTNLNDDELEAFFTDAPHCVCFVACRNDETSHSSSHLKHGIWTHHVLQALHGNAPLAMFKQRYVTIDSLQNYVAQAVPRTLRAEFTTPRVQTPWMCGGLPRDFVLADLSSTLEDRRLAAAKLVPRLDTVVISSTDRARVKTLSGFKKTHRVPDQKNATTAGFIAQISEPELQTDLDETFQSLRNEYKFKRLDLEKRGPSDGIGVIITPYFEYSVSIELADHDTSEVIWRREVGKISDPTKIFCDEFENVFSGVFDTIEISTSIPVNVSSVVDRIEQLDSTEVSVDYDADCTECTVQITGLKAAIRVTEDCLFIKDPQTNSPKSLLEAALFAQRRLTQEFGIKTLPAV